MIWESKMTKPITCDECRTTIPIGNRVWHITITQPVLIAKNFCSPGCRMTWEIKASV